MPESQVNLKTSNAVTKTTDLCGELIKYLAKYSKSIILLIWSFGILMNVGCFHSVWAEEHAGTNHIGHTSAKDNSAKDTEKDAGDDDLTGGTQTDQVLIRGLNKVTAHISDIVAPVGQKVMFGSLEIIPHLCQKSPPEEPPESTAYLDIQELKPGEKPVSIFSGWMFASLPAISALEHPVYDIWVLNCQGRIVQSLPVVDQGLHSLLDKDLDKDKGLPPSEPSSSNLLPQTPVAAAFNRGFYHAR